MYYLSGNAKEHLLDEGLVRPLMSISPGNDSLGSDWPENCYLPAWNRTVVGTSSYSLFSTKVDRTRNEQTAWMASLLRLETRL